MSGERAPKALIAPHAGTVYSGPVAASGYLQLAALRGQVRRVVLLGPSHRLAFHGIAASSATAFATPLGELPVGTSAVESVMDNCANVQLNDEAHRREHSLELHLPFVTAALGEVELVPLVVGSAPAEVVAEAIDVLWGGRETLIVVSTDLSHFHDYEEARVLDRETTARIEQLDGASLCGERACGYQPVRGLLLTARRRGLEVRTVDVRSSGDTAGGRDRVVGYGSYLLS